MTSKEFNSVFYGTVLKAEIIDFIWSGSETFSEQMQRITIVFELFHKGEYHPLLLLIILCINTGSDKLNLLNIKVKLRNYFKHFFSVIFS